MKVLFECKVCGEVFDSLPDFWGHKETCPSKNTFGCSKCGKIISWGDKDPDAIVKMNQCHIIDAGIAGFGSKLDGCHIDFNLCDDCLFSFINTFRHKDDIC